MDTSALLGTRPSAARIGGMIAAGLRRSAPDQGGRRARSSVGRACGVRLRRRFQGRRQGGEERHRLRSLQAAGGLLGHAGGDDRGDAEGDAAAGSERTLVLRGLDDVAANKAMTAALGSPYDVSGAAHLPGSALRGVRGPLGEIGAAGAVADAAAAGGHHRRRPAHRAGSLGAMLAPFRQGRAARRCRLGRGLGCDPRRRAVRGRRRRGRCGRCGGSSVRRRRAARSVQALARDSRRRGDLRLGRRPDLGGAAAVRRRAMPACCARRVDAIGGHATLIRASERDQAPGRCVSSAAGRPRRARAAGQALLRPEEHPQPRPDAARIRDMKTEFSLAQLADPDIAEADKILRACVHCGFCTATCPTYVLLGDELDSPRGRIYLIKEMLEKEPAADRRGGQTYRPLPVVPRLHDHLSVRRELHASGRSGAGADRAGLRPAAGRTGLLRAVLAWMMPQPASVPPRHDAGAVRPAAGRLAARPRTASAARHC